MASIVRLLTSQHELFLIHPAAPFLFSGNSPSSKRTRNAVSIFS
ncbi:hypothetical protein BMETH_1651_0 [methanotrophic bacterial endosymbiont of Bathymodiolus sp.]|nr:hypothetical protein BMETH_1651_0 [methanotrophic bacterial endosymbiont of Bathymodiolus sp.]